MRPWQPGRANELTRTYDLFSGRTVKVTNSLLAAMDSGDMVEPYLVHYPPGEGLEISAFVYVPHNLERDADLERRLEMMSKELEKIKERLERLDEEVSKR